MSTGDDLQLTGDLACQNAEIRSTLLVAGAAPLATVAHDATLTGDGTLALPLSVVPVVPVVPRVIQIASARLLVNVTALNALAPGAYAVFPLSASLVSTVGTFLQVQFSATARHTGAAATVAINFRFRLNAALISPGGGTTINVLVNQIGNVVYSLRVPIVAGVQAITIDWGGFALPVGNSLVCDPLALPNLNHAQLTIEEQS